MEAANIEASLREKARVVLLVVNLVDPRNNIGRRIPRLIDSVRVRSRKMLGDLLDIIGFR